jgi:hypothetical protein
MSEQKGPCLFGTYFNVFLTNSASPHGCLPPLRKLDHSSRRIHQCVQGSHWGINRLLQSHGQNWKAVRKIHQSRWTHATLIHLFCFQSGTWTTSKTCTVISRISSHWNRSTLSSAVGGTASLDEKNRKRVKETI